MPSVTTYKIRENFKKVDYLFYYKFTYDNAVKNGVRKKYIIMAATKKLLRFNFLLYSSKADSPKIPFLWQTSSKVLVEPFIKAFLLFSRQSNLCNH